VFLAAVGAFELFGPIIGLLAASEPSSSTDTGAGKFKTDHPGLIDND